MTPIFALLVKKTNETVKKRKIKATWERNFWLLSIDIKVFFFSFFFFALL